MDDVYQRCVEAYRYMLQHGVVRSASWLEGHEFDIEFLPDFDAEVVIYRGPLKNIAYELSWTNAETSKIVGIVQACGWVHRYRIGMYALYKDPTEDDYVSYLHRVDRFENSTGKHSVRREMEMHVTQLHRKYDEVLDRLQELEQEVRGLRPRG